nr:probable plastid-lipid-associated protein 4, chloroplastic [Ipomoea batatas]
MAFSTLSAPATQLIAAHSSAHNHPKLSLSAAAATFSFPATHNGHSSSGLVSISAPCNDPKWRASVSFFPGFLKLNKTKDPEPIKEELFEALAPLDRGADATPEDQEKIEQAKAIVQNQGDTQRPRQQATVMDLSPKNIELISCEPLAHVSDIKLIRTDTTLDLSQKAEKDTKLIRTDTTLDLSQKAEKDYHCEQRPKFLRSRTNYQGINADTLRAQNLESWPTFNQARAIVQNQGDAQKPRQQATLMGLSPKKIELISCEPMAHVSDIKLIRTDTTLDLSQKAEKDLVEPTLTLRFMFLQVTADLTPVNASKVSVKFDYFKIAGLIPIKAPDRACGSLDITYLDKELRVSRGDKGNLFILKMVDPSYRVPV